MAPPRVSVALREDQRELLAAEGEDLPAWRAPQQRRKWMTGLAVVGFGAAALAAGVSRTRRRSGAALRGEPATGPQERSVQGAYAVAVASPRKAPWECASEGMSCLETKCCASPGSRCFRKNEFWAACRQTCAPGEEVLGDEVGGPWSCEALSGPAPALCAWEHENCKVSGCCRREGFSCFEKDEAIGKCGSTCEEARSKAKDLASEWTCRNVGGSVGVHVVQSSESPAATTLYCFAVVTPSGVVPPGVKEGYEEDLLDMMRKKDVGIFACNAHDVFKGARVEKGDWESVVNTDIFLHAWSEVSRAGTYRKWDWTVKVDADAVFFPQRLRMHLDSLAPPAGTPVYLHNIKFKFHFMGALEVLSAKAVDAFLESMGDCSKSFGLGGGEDYFTMQCLDAAFVGHMTDFSLLDDKYTHGEGWHLFDVSPCINEAIVAFHPYKHVNAWEGCWNVSMGHTKPAEYVGCNLRWHGDACSLTSKLAHLPTDPETLKGVVGDLRAWDHGSMETIIEKKK